jgi:GPH family glycoside/pentoside/hexuronide:cation symporter
MGLALAFVALPLYVLLPNHYAKNFGVSLSALGGVLLVTRLADAVIDPLLGRWVDRLFVKSLSSVRRFTVVACVVMATGFAALFFPPVRTPEALLWVSAALLMLTYASFSAVTVAHQTWGAMLGGSAQHQSRVVAWREGLGLVGVVLASVVPSVLGLEAMVGLFVLALSAGWWAWGTGPRPNLRPIQHEVVQASSNTPKLNTAPTSLVLPFQDRAFVRLISVFVVNGMASAIPATLMLFFVQDRLQAPAGMETVFLGTFFVCAAASMPLWLKAVARWGLARSWLLGMWLSTAVFVGASLLGQGDTTAFVLICVLSGLAMGADLALPGALLAGVIQNSERLQSAQATCWGWWNFATKLNLALAAGVALPVLGALGYTPGARDASALQALTVAYCVLPCVLKMMASGGLYIWLVRPQA